MPSRRVTQFGGSLHQECGDLSSGIKEDITDYPGKLHSQQYVPKRTEAPIRYTRAREVARERNLARRHPVRRRADLRHRRRIWGAQRRPRVGEVPRPDVRARVRSQRGRSAHPGPAGRAWGTRQLLRARLRRGDARGYGPRHRPAGSRDRPPRVHARASRHAVQAAGGRGARPGFDHPRRPDRTAALRVPRPVCGAQRSHPGAAGRTGVSSTIPA